MGAFLARPARVAAVVAIFSTFSTLSNPPLTLDPPPQVFIEDFTTSTPPVLLPQAFPYNANNTTATSSQALALISSASGEHNPNPLFGVAALVTLLQAVLFILELSAPTGSAAAEFFRVYRYVVDIAGIAYPLLASSGFQFAPFRDAVWTIVIAIAITTWRRQARAARARDAVVQVREADLPPRNVQMVNGGTQTAEEPTKMQSRLVQTTERIPSLDEIKRLQKSDRQLKSAQQEDERMSLDLRKQRPLAVKALVDKALQLKYDEQTNKCKGLEERITDLENALEEKTNALDMMEENPSSKLVAQMKKCQDFEAEVTGLNSMLEEKAQALSFKDDDMTAMTSKHAQQVANFSRKDAAKDKILRRKAREASRKTEELNEKSKALSALEEAMTQSEAAKHADLPRQYEQLNAKYEKLSRKEAQRQQEILDCTEYQNRLFNNNQELRKKNEELRRKNQALSTTNSNISSQLSDKNNQLTQKTQTLKQVTTRSANHATLLKEVRKTLLENFEISESAVDYLLDQGDMCYEDKLDSRATLRAIIVERIMHRRDSGIVRKKAAQILMEKFDLSEQDAALLLEKGELNEHEDNEESKDDKDTDDHEPRNKDGDDDEDDDDDHDNGKAPKVRALKEKTPAPTEASRLGDDANDYEAHGGGGNDANELGDAAYNGRANQMEDVSFESSEASGGNDKPHTDISELQDDDGFSVINTNDASANQPGSHGQSMEDISFENGEPWNVDGNLHASIPELENEAPFSAINTTGALANQPDSDEQSMDVQMNELNVHDNDEHMGIDDEEDPADDLERALAMDTDSKDSGNQSGQLVDTAPVTSLEIADGTPEAVYESGTSASTRQQDSTTTMATLPSPSRRRPAEGTVRRASASKSIFFKPYKAGKVPDSRFKRELRGDTRNSANHSLDTDNVDIMEYECDVKNLTDKSVAPSAGLSQLTSFPSVSTPTITSLGQPSVNLNVETSSVLNHDFNTASGPPISALMHPASFPLPSSNNITPANASSSLNDGTSGSVIEGADVQMFVDDGSIDSMRTLIVENFPRGTTEDRIITLVNGDDGGMQRCEILSTDPKVTAVVTFRTWSDASDAYSATEGALEGGHKLTARFADREEVRQVRQQTARRQIPSASEANDSVMRQAAQTQNIFEYGKPDKGKAKQHVQNDMTDEIDSKEDEARPCIVIAKNFPQGTTEKLIVQNMKKLGCKVLNCKILATEPLVTFKITFGSERDAKTAISKYDSKNFYGNKLHFYQTDREGVESAKQDAIAARPKLGGNKLAQLQAKRAAQMGSAGQQIPLGAASPIAATPATNAASTPMASPASTAAPAQATASTPSNTVCFWKGHDFDANGNMTATYPCSNGPNCQGDTTMYDRRGVVPLPTNGSARVWLYGGVNVDSDRAQKMKARKRGLCFACWKAHPDFRPTRP